MHCLARAMNFARDVAVVSSVGVFFALAHGGCSAGSADPSADADAGEITPDAGIESATPSFSEGGAGPSTKCDDPLSPPLRGAACTATGRCSIGAVGCTVSVLECRSGLWTEPSAPSTCADCPASAPADGSGCSIAVKCQYAATAATDGGTTCALDTAVCFDTDRKWHKNIIRCASTCPATKPGEGDPCDSIEYCVYAGTCHDLDIARCKAGGWNIETRCR